METRVAAYLSILAGATLTTRQLERAPGKPTTCLDKLVGEEGLSSPLGAQMFDFCDNGFFPEALQTSEVSSSSGCCFDENSYVTDLSFPSFSLEMGNFGENVNYNDNENNTNSISNQDEQNNNRDETLSIFFDSQQENEPENPTSLPAFPIPSLINAGQHDQFDMSAFQPQIPLTDMGGAESGSSFGSSSSDVTPPPPQQQMLLMSVLEGDCPSTALPSYVHLDPSLPSCSALDESGLSGFLGSPNMNAGISVEAYGMFSRNAISDMEFQSQELDFQGENGSIYCAESVYSSEELQVFGEKQQQQQQLVVSGCGSPARFASDMSGFEDSSYKVRRLSVEERKEKIHRYMKKRNERNFAKKIKAQLKSKSTSKPNTNINLPATRTHSPSIGQDSVSGSVAKTYLLVVPGPASIVPCHCPLYCKQGSSLAWLSHKRNRKLQYACRKTLADSRPRVRGRFAKNEEFGEVVRATFGSNHEDEDSDGVVVKEEVDNIHDSSDIFAHISGRLRDECFSKSSEVLRGTLGFDLLRDFLDVLLILCSAFCGEGLVVLCIGSVFVFPTSSDECQKKAWLCLRAPPFGFGLPPIKIILKHPQFHTSSVCFCGFGSLQLQDRLRFSSLLFHQRLAGNFSHCIAPNTGMDQKDFRTGPPFVESNSAWLAMFWASHDYDFRLPGSTDVGRDGLHRGTGQSQMSQIKSSDPTGMLTSHRPRGRRRGSAHGRVVTCYDSRPSPSYRLFVVFYSSPILSTSYVRCRRRLLSLSSAVCPSSPRKALVEVEGIRLIFSLSFLWRICNIFFKQVTAGHTRLKVVVDRYG
ncbi:hypothetical protein ACLOJK_011247 [Asimina triloba]